MGKVVDISNLGILATTGDAFRSSRMQRMLSNLTTSYKLYWLAGIFEEVVAGRTHLAFARVAARMVAAAWYPVAYFRLSLGASDQIGSCVSYVRNRFGLAPDAREDEIVALVESCDDAGLRNRVGHLCDYVPYRLIRPFYDDAFTKMRRDSGAIRDRDVNPTVLALNREDPAGAPYRIDGTGSALDVDLGWAAYFRDNETLVRGWLDMELVRYLQARNPSVPAIPLKAHRPSKRDLASAQSFWRDVVDNHEVRDIYTGEPLCERGYESRGPLSIDHFVPWSFVLHDEPWNLVPTFRDVNSSKSDRLPDLGLYLEPFCELQFDALMTAKAIGGHRKVLEAYLTVDPHALEYERTNAARESFCSTIRNAVVPLHQIALNQGFGIWGLRV